MSLSERKRELAVHVVVLAVVCVIISFLVESRNL